MAGSDDLSGPASDIVTVWITRAPGVEPGSDPGDEPGQDVECWTATPGTEIGFGRTGEITLGDNPYLHRTLGRFSYVVDTTADQESGWTLRNDGGRIALSVSGHPKPIGPGSSAMLDPSGRISFVAGSEQYELRYRLEAERFDLIPPPLGRRHQRVLLALCEPRLRRPDGQRVLVPSVSQIASRVALTLPQVNECINGLSDRHRQSLSDSQPSTDTVNADDTPLESLVRWAVATQMVTIAQLDSLNTPVTQIERRP